MPQIILRVTKGPDAGKVFTLEQTPIKIGRARKNDVYINDTAISGFHATIIFKDGCVFIQDHSKNGTYVNGKRIKESVLTEGDEILVGLSGFRFSLESKEETQLLEEATKVKECDETVRKEGFAQKRKAAKKKIRPIMIVVPLVIIVLGLVYLLSKPNKSPEGKQKQENRKQSDTIIKIPLVNIEQEWIRLDTGNILDKKIRGKLIYGKELYDRQEGQTVNLYNAIKNWKEALNSLEGEKKNILQRIINTSEKQLDDKYKDEYNNLYFSIKQKNYPEAAKVCVKIMQMIPDPNDPRYRKVKKIYESKGLGRYLSGK